MKSPTRDQHAALMLLCFTVGVCTFLQYSHQCFPPECQEVFGISSAELELLVSGCHADRLHDVLICIAMSRWLSHLRDPCVNTDWPHVSMQKCTSSQTSSRTGAGILTRTNEVLVRRGEDLNASVCNEPRYNASQTVLLKQPVSNHNKHGQNRSWRQTNLRFASRS